MQSMASGTAAMENAAWIDCEKQLSLTESPNATLSALLLSEDRIDQLLHQHIRVLVSVDGSDQARTEPGGNFSWPRPYPGPSSSFSDPARCQSSCAFEWVLHGFTQSDRETDLLIVLALRDCICASAYDGLDTTRFTTMTTRRRGMGC